MRQIPAITAAVILLAFLKINLCLAQKTASDSVPAPLKCGMYQNPPKIFIDDTGQPGGFFPEILAVIAGKEKWEIEYVPGTFDEGLNRVRAGTLDMMPDVAWSAERAEEFL